ncbi:unnamed protein product [Auanema sp. JU1783]|nr:unnamed protein product [Auanema sp. JU1783]
MLLLIIATVLGASTAQEALADPRCNEWLDPGECNNFTVKWYYDRYDHRCREFYYSGCGGNTNNFNSIEECSSSCFFREPERTDRCQLPHDPGHCQSDIERWYFDYSKKQCVCSWWSGCGGNENRYYSYNHCMEICGTLASPGIGPGIDWAYWGRQNGPSLSPEVLQLFGYTQDTVNEVRNGGQQPSYHNQRVQQPLQQPATELEVIHHQNLSESVNSQERTAVTDHQRDQALEVHPAVPYNGYQLNEGSTYAELKTSPEEIIFQPGEWKNTTDEHGNNIFQFSSNPQVTVSESGRTTTNRSVLVIMHPPNQERVQQNVHLPSYLPSDFMNQNKRVQAEILRKRAKYLKKQKVPPRQIYPQTSSRVTEQQQQLNEQPQQYYYQPVQYSQPSPKEKYFFIRYNLQPDGQAQYYEKLSWSGLKTNPLIGLPVQYHRMVLDTYNEAERRSPQIGYQQRLAPQNYPSNSHSRNNMWTPAVPANTLRNGYRQQPRMHNSFVRPTYPTLPVTPAARTTLSTPKAPLSRPTFTTTTTTTTTTTPKPITTTSPYITTIPPRKAWPTPSQNFPTHTYPRYETTPLPRPVLTTVKPMEDLRPRPTVSSKQLTMEEIIELDASKHGDEEYDDDVPGQFFRMAVKTTKPPRTTRVPILAPTSSPRKSNRPDNNAGSWKRIVLPPTEEEAFDFEINVVGE